MKNKDKTLCLLKVRYEVFKVYSCFLAYGPFMTVIPQELFLFGFLFPGRHLNTR